MHAYIYFVTVYEAGRRVHVHTYVYVIVKVANEWEVMCERVKRWWRNVRLGMDGYMDEVLEEYKHTYICTYICTYIHK